MPRFKDRAICIRMIDWSETSQIVAFLTEQHGLVRAVAKGAKRTSPSSVARYSGGLELLTRGQAVGVIKRTSDLATLTEWDLQEPYWHLHRDLGAQRLGCYAADLARAFVPDLEPHPVVFVELAALLGALGEPGPWDRALLRYQWRLLDDCGYRPRLDTGESASVGHGDGGGRRYVFDARAGGLVGGLGADRDAQNVGGVGGVGGNGRWAVREGTVRALGAVAGGADGATDAKSMGRANRLLCAYARAILDRELPTMRYVLGDKV